MTIFSLTEPNVHAIVGLLGHITGACLVSLHVLLRKRDVPAAIGWIGIAWLAPAIGIVLYFGFGINRVQRRARRLMGSETTYNILQLSGGDEDNLGDLANAIRAVTRRPLSEGRVVSHLFCGDKAYPVMLEAIRKANKEVRLATYIFRLDSVGEEFISVLANARRRGVEVSVLIDGFGGGFLLSPAYRRLQAEGVTVVRFLHSFLPWRMPFLNLRLHKKILTIDSKVAFIGGLNIGAENLLSSNPRFPVCDHHFEVNGDIVSEIEREFDEDWQFATGMAFKKTRIINSVSEEKNARTISSGPDQETDHLVLVLLSAINASRQTIRIATPYFLPDEQLITALRLAAFRGISVDIVLPANNNHPFVQWASRAHIRPLVESGCRIWQNPPPFDHSKLMTIDGRWTLLGSANWDARSLRLNFELTIEFYNIELAKEIEKIIDHCRGRQITLKELDRRHIVVKLRDAAVRLAMPYI